MASSAYVRFPPYVDSNNDGEVDLLIYTADPETLKRADSPRQRQDDRIHRLVK